MPGAGELIDARMQRDAGELDRRSDLDPRQISSRWPRRPKPVTSVSAWTPGIEPNAIPGVLSWVVLASIAA